MSLEYYAAYVLACIVIIIVPGPTVTLIVANSLRDGTRAGLLNVAGTQIGLGMIIAAVGFGLASAVESMGHWFDWLRLAGAAYLIWMGWKMLFGKIEDDAGVIARPRGGYLLQGLIVALSNPKTLVFFGAFFPQFLDPTGDQAAQIMLMGVTAMIFAAVSDGFYAIAAGRTAGLISKRRVRVLTRVSGGFLIGGGLWLAFSRAR
ncbi:MAG: LysE family translocator [Rhizobiaceae bacterium]|nr:LysE family translocator [Rhizobiaceae bacterium]